MSEYFLADHYAEERERLRQGPREPRESQDMKITLLGDFMFPSNEPRGCDPYNNTHGSTAREAWRTRRDRR